MLHAVGDRSTRGNATPVPVPLPLPAVPASDAWYGDPAVTASLAPQGHRSIRGVRAAMVAGLLGATQCSTAPREGKDVPTEATSSHGSLSASVAVPGSAPAVGLEPPRDWSPCVARSIASEAAPATWVRKATQELTNAPDATVARRALTDLGGALASVPDPDARGLSLSLVAEALVAKGDQAGGTKLAEGAEAAATHTSTGLTLDKDEALRHVAAVYATVGQHDRAGKIAGSDVEARATVADAYMKTGDTKRADKILEELKAHPPHAPGAQLALVEALAARGKVEEARVAAGHMTKDRDIALAHILEHAPLSTPKVVLAGIADMAIATADNSLEPWDHRVRVYLLVARGLVRIGDTAKAGLLRERAADWAREHAETAIAAEVFSEVATDAADAGDVDGALGTLERLGHPPLGSLTPDPLTRVLVLTRAHRLGDALAAAREVTAGAGFALLVIATRSAPKRVEDSVDQQVSALACPG
jgi:hypothetical protein